MQDFANKQYVYPSLDLMKFICSVLVVMIHITPFGEYEFLNFVIHNYVARIAVPYFFVTSGFLLFRKTSNDDFNINYTFKYVLRLLRMYLIWSVVYFYLNYRIIINDERGSLHGILIYIRDFIFVGSYGGLWYLNATIFSVTLISILIKKKCSLRLIILLAGILYILGLFDQSWFGLITPLRQIPEFWFGLRLLQKVIVTTRNGLFEGFLFVGFGMMFAFNLIKITRKKALWGFIISMLFMFIETIVVRHFNLAKQQDMYLFLVPVTFFLFDLVLHMEIKERKIYSILRVLSVLIFYIHVWIIFIVNESFDYLNIDVNSTTLKFILVIFLSILVSCGILKISRMKQFWWFQYLYS